MADRGAAGPLKLRAEDSDDLVVLSACLQDALVPVRDLAYVPDEQLFVFVANRFRWERRIPQEAGINERQRVLCAVSFADVSAVAYRGFRRSDEERILALLAIRAEAHTPGGIAIRLEFSGDATIRLDAARVRCRARDLGEPWPTRWHPRHDEDRHQ
ncbi:MAG TPA: DUF2948 family protein [Stellaceae bacterium]|nr:DUF2948 family protein [Stellaceae bacterium]